MANLKVKVTVDKSALTKFDAELKALQQKAPEIKLKVTGGAEDLKKISAELVEYSRTSKQAAADDRARAAAMEKIAVANAQQAAAEAKTRLEIEKTNREKEKTVQTENKRQSAHERTVQSQNRLAAAEQRTQQELLKTERAVTRTSSAWQRMFSAFSVSNIVSSGVTMAISRMRQYFREALTEMQNLDTALSHYRQVTGASEGEASAIGQASYATASKYGTSASDYVESIATYARAGYQEMSDELAELSLKTVIVG